MRKNGYTRRTPKPIGDAEELALSVDRGGTVKRRRRRVTRGALLSVVSPALVLTACGGPENDASGDGPDRAETSFAFAVALEPTQWNFPFDTAASAGGVAGSLLMYNVVEPLLGVAEDGSMAPHLAESFEVSGDGTEYRFALREATFHDGSELDAADVVYSLNTAKEGTDPVSIAALKAVETIEAEDDRTVTVTLSRPSLTFFRNMAGTPGSVVPEGSAEDMAQQPIGTGPFMFDEWRQGSEVTFTRFVDYWGEQPPAEQVAWRFIPDEQARLNALFANEIDLFTQFENQDEVDAITSHGYSVGKAEKAPSVEALVLNSENETFQDERVRQAIAHALDRESIAAAVFPVSGTPRCVWVESLLSVDTDYCPYPYDPDRSRKLLADAGVEDLRVEIKYPAARFWPALVAIVASQLQDVGIGTDLSGIEINTWVNELYQPDTRDYQLGHASSGPTLFNGSCPSEWTGDCYEELDELVKRLESTVDQAEAQELMQQALELFADRAYAIPIIGLAWAYASRGDLVGFSFGGSKVPQLFYDLRSVRIEE